MPIDPKKIAELKELVRIGDLPYGSTHGKGGEYIAPGDIWNELEYLPAAGEALPLLLAERSEMLALLREVEWKGCTGHDDGDGRIDVLPDGCPVCGRIRWASEGHAPDCRLAAFLGKTLDT